MVAATAPERCHYSGSDSLPIRTKCAVEENNIGVSNLNDLNEKLGVSSGSCWSSIRAVTNKKKIGSGSESK